MAVDQSNVMNPHKQHREMSLGKNYKDKDTKKLSKKKKK